MKKKKYMYSMDKTDNDDDSDDDDDHVKWKRHVSLLECSTRTKHMAQHLSSRKEEKKKMED